MNRTITIAAVVLLLAGCGQNKTQKAAEEAALNLRRADIEMLYFEARHKGIEVLPDSTFLLSLPEDLFRDLYNSIVGDR